MLSRNASKLRPCHSGAPTARKNASYTSSVVDQAAPSRTTSFIATLRDNPAHAPAFVCLRTRRGITGNGLALPIELHDVRPWQDLNLRPSKEPSHITTGETPFLFLIAGEWAMRYRHCCLPQTEVLRPRSNRDQSPPANAL